MDTPNFQRALHRGTDFELSNDLKEAFDLDATLIEYDMSHIEQRAQEFFESSQLWDDRILGAEEEFTEICADPDAYRATRDLARDRDETKDEELRRIALELRQVIKERGNDIIVLGGGGRRVGTLTGAIVQSIVSSYAQFFVADAETLPAKDIFDNQPVHYKQDRIRKGKGHHKFKKGKKK